MNHFILKSICIFLPFPSWFTTVLLNSSISGQGMSLNWRWYFTLEQRKTSSSSGELYLPAQRCLLSRTKYDYSHIFEFICFQSIILKLNEIELNVSPLLEKFIKTCTLSYSRFISSNIVWRCRNSFFPQVANEPSGKPENILFLHFLVTIANKCREIYMNSP